MIQEQTAYSYDRLEVSQQTLLIQQCRFQRIYMSLVYQVATALILDYGSQSAQPRSPESFWRGCDLLFRHAR